MKYVSLVPTFFGNISVAKIYGIGIIPIQLIKMINAKQNNGMNSYCG